MADVVGEHAGGVDDSPRQDREFLAGLLVSRPSTLDPTFVLEQRGHGKVIQRAALQINEGARQRDRQPSVIELAVRVDDAAAQSCLADRGNSSNDLGPRDPARAAQIETPRQPVVEP